MPAAFDLAYCLWTSFGYFDDDRDDLRTLRNVYESLSTGGVFVIEVLGKEVYARLRQNAFCEKLPDGSLLLQRAEVVADWTRVRDEWVFIQDERAKSFHVEFTIYSGRELRDRLLEAGFTSVKLHGDLEGKPYGAEASRLVAVAGKA